MTATHVLLALLTAIIGVGIPILRKEFKEMGKRVDTCHDKQIVSETKLDIFLAAQGFDVSKVNGKIKEHMDLLKRNDVPHVGGCIKIEELYKEK